MKINNIEPLVVNVLTYCKEAQVDDYVLYKYVLKMLGYDLSISADKFLSTIQKSGMPSFKTVERCRRKVQSKKIEARLEKEKEFREYGRER